MSIIKKTFDYMYASGKTPWMVWENGGSEKDSGNGRAIEAYTSDGYVDSDVLEYKDQEKLNVEPGI